MKADLDLASSARSSVGSDTPGMYYKFFFFLNLSESSFMGKDLGQ